MVRFLTERKAVLHGVAGMTRLGLAPGTSGNLSVRLPGEPWLACITPTSYPYDCMTEDDLVVLDARGNVVEGRLAPSSERAVHLAVYAARPDAGAVVHTHSTHASALAVAGLPLPPILDEVVVAIGGEVRVAGYGFPGTRELADNAVAALEGRAAVLLRHHGAVAVGHTPDEAVATAHLLERAAQVYLLARSLGPVPALPPDVIAREQELFRKRWPPVPPA